MVSGLLGDCRSAALQGHAGVSGGAGQGGLCGVWRRAVGLGGTVRTRAGCWRLGDCCAGRKLRCDFTGGLFSSLFFFFFSSEQLVDLHHKVNLGCLLSELRGKKKKQKKHHFNC